MTVAFRPEWFAGGDAAPDGTGWEIGSEVYPTNPRAMVTREDRDMIRSWVAWRGGGMGMGHLPDPGGYDDQGAVLMDLFGIASETYDDLPPRAKDEHA